MKFETGRAQRARSKTKIETGRARRARSKTKIKTGRARRSLTDFIFSLVPYAAFLTVFDSVMAKDERNGVSCNFSFIENEATRTKMKIKTAIYLREETNSISMLGYARNVFYKMKRVL